MLIDSFIRRNAPRHLMMKKFSKNVIPSELPSETSDTTDGKIVDYKNITENMSFHFPNS